MTPFLSYNNLVFPSSFTSMPRSRFQYDRAGRTVGHTVHTITASFKTVAPLGDGIDAYVLLVRQRLSKAGMPLRYIGSGAGGLLVNINVNGPQDVVWGPKPQSLNVKPLGGGNAVTVEWVVEVAIPDCSGASYKGIAEATNNITYDTTEIGLVNRTMEYSVRIASRRSATGRAILDSPDNYLSAVIPPLVPGFRRSFGPRHINDAKDTVSGTVVDEQMGGVYPPPYVTKWKMDARMSAKGAAGIKWFGTISADYITAVNCPDLSIPA